MFTVAFWLLSGEIVPELGLSVAKPVVPMLILSMAQLSYPAPEKIICDQRKRVAAVWAAVGIYVSMRVKSA